MAYRDVRKKLDETRGSSANCRQCRAPADWQMLTDHGGLCFPCFKAYCREPFVRHEPCPQAVRVRAEIAALGMSLPP